LILFSIEGLTLQKPRGLFFFLFDSGTRASFHIPIRPLKFPSLYHTRLLYPPSGLFFPAAKAEEGALFLLFGSSTNLQRLLLRLLVMFLADGPF